MATTAKWPERCDLNARRARPNTRQKTRLGDSGTDCRIVLNEPATGRRAVKGRVRAPVSRPPLTAGSSGGCQTGERDEVMRFFREQSDWDMCIGTTAGDDAGGQAAIPSASLFADRGGTTERFPHRMPRLLELVPRHEHYRFAFISRVGRHSSILRHLCNNHPPLDSSWRAALRCNPARWRDRGRKGKGGRLGSP